MFALVRGYQEKWKYGALILRNLSVRILLLRLRGSCRSDVILFHEGNITPFDRRILAILSLGPLKFVDVSGVFKRAPHHVWTRHDESEGYSLMCKFNYHDVWKLLENYDVVIRVDEDCLVLSLPPLEDEEVFTTGMVTGENHKPTNRSLPRYLEQRGLRQFYDHLFPYTNVYQTRPSFWLQEEVGDYLRWIWENPQSVDKRWGDLPVLGVALKAFGAWDHRTSVIPRYRYVHLSHLVFVGGGKSRMLGSRLLDSLRQAYLKR